MYKESDIFFKVVGGNEGELPMGCHKPWQLKYYKLWHSMGVPKYKD